MCDPFNIVNLADKVKLEVRLERLGRILLADYYALAENSII